MKDNWIQPFQDKLGDYEFDLPAPQGRKIGWWVPLLAGAAAALLLMLLLRTPESRQQPAPAFALADASPSLTLPAPAHPQDIRLIRRNAVPASVPTQPETGEHVTAPAEETPAEATPIPAEDAPVTPVNPTPDFTPVSATEPPRAVHCSAASRISGTVMDEYVDLEKTGYCVRYGASSGTISFIHTSSLTSRLMTL